MLLRRDDLSNDLTERNDRAAELLRRPLSTDGVDSVPLRRTIWFREQPGFGLREYASGRRMYVVECPTPTGRRTIILGNAEVVDHRTALDVARRCIYYAHSEEAENPAERRKRVRRTPMFQDYLNDYWRILYPQWKPATQHTEDKYRRLYLADAFQDRGVDEITHEDVSRCMVEKTRKGAPGAVNRAFQRLKAALQKAEEWGFRQEGSNPCRQVRQNPRRKVERFLSEQEFARLGTAMRDSSIDRPMHNAALMLLLLTGCRKEEIVGMTWGEVRGARIYLDDSKTGARTVHLCSQAQSILANLKRRKPGDPVFKGHLGGGISLDDYWKRLRREAGLGKIRIHDLRHSYASLAARKALPLPTIQRLLGHANLESTARYTHFDDSHLAVVAQSISDLIERVCRLGK